MIKDISININNKKNVYHAIECDQCKRRLVDEGQSLWITKEECRYAISYYEWEETESGKILCSDCRKNKSGL